jgi:folylpolyglutamate synthase/dihydropteroate synthase
MDWKGLNTEGALQVAPISVYTSGKGSSAAGLTASVQRDSVSVGTYFPPHSVMLLIYQYHSENSILKEEPWSWLTLE